MNKLIDVIKVLARSEMEIFTVDFLTEPNYDLIDIYIITEKRILYAYDFASGVDDTIPSLSLLPGGNRFVQQDITIPDDKRYFRVIVKEPNANDFAKLHLVVLGKKKSASGLVNNFFFTPSITLRMSKDANGIPFWFLLAGSDVIFVPLLYNITAKKLDIVANTNGANVSVQTDTFSTTINSTTKQLFTFNINDIVNFVELKNLDTGIDAYIYSVFIEL
jgi:hypothetical protein